MGIQPDVIICRSDAPVPRDILEKISLFCNIPVENAIPNLTAPVLYEVPLMLEREGLADVVVRRLGLICHMPDLTEWATMVHRAKHPQGSVEIALVGKYVALHDAYLSVAEALTHGGIENDVKVNIRWVDSETVTDGNAAELLDYEFNNEYRDALTQAGLELAGLSPDGRLVEIVELPGHPWFVGVQFHPELKSRPNKAHPLFRAFIAAAKENRSC